jgi:hypothetical protein
MVSIGGRCVCVCAFGIIGFEDDQSLILADIETVLSEAHAAPFSVALDKTQCTDVLTRLGLARDLASDLWALCVPSGEEERHITLQEILTAMVATNASSALREKLVQLCLVFSPQAVETRSPAQLELHYDDCYLCTYVALRIVLSIVGDPAADDSAELARVAECIADDVFVVARKTVDEYLVTDDLLHWAKARGVDERRHHNIRDLHDLNSVLPLEARFRSAK